MYGHNVVLPWEVRTGSRRVTLQNDLSAEVYKNLMIDNLEDLSCLRLRALEKTLKPINRGLQNITIKGQD